MVLRSLPLIVLTLAGCVFGPVNDQELASTSSSVTVSGYLPFGSTMLRVEASSSPAGPWTSIGSTVSSGTSFHYAGTNLFPFSTSVVVPASLWHPQGCDQVVYLRVLESNYDVALNTFEAIAPGGGSAISCIGSEVSGGASLGAAVETCNSPDSPVLRLRVPDPSATSHTGNLVLASPADAAPYACLEVLYGDLVVEEESLAGFPTSLPSIALPALQEVHGDVDIDYQLPFVPSGAQARRVELPSLHTVTGSLWLNSDRLDGGSGLATVDVGMNALTTVGGGVSLTSDITGTTWRGLETLTIIPGDLVMDIHGDWSIFGVLEQLRHVQGNVDLTLDHNGSTGLPELRWVDGNFTQNGGIHFAPQGPAFAGLRSVGGDFTLVDVPMTHWLFMDLHTVGGTLRLDDSVSTASGLTVGDPFGLLVGSVEVVNNPVPTGPGLFNVEPDPPQAITFQNNPNMCTSAIQSWIASRPSYFGPVTLSNNDTGC
jgi:hypothetical protein